MECEASWREGSNGRNTLYAINVVVPLAMLRIADFSNWPVDHLVTAVFSRAETCNVPGRGQANYVVSQVVGYLISQYFDGMRTPGVRGKPNSHYKNLVLFKSLSEWSKWTDIARPVFLIEDPTTRAH